jgi:hypothetical protein
VGPVTAGITVPAQSSQNAQRMLGLEAAQHPVAGQGDTTSGKASCLEGRASATR